MEAMLYDTDLGTGYCSTVVVAKLFSCFSLVVARLVAACKSDLHVSRLTVTLGTLKTLPLLELLGRPTVNSASLMLLGRLPDQAPGLAVPLLLPAPVISLQVTAPPRPHNTLYRILTNAVDMKEDRGVTLWVCWCGRRNTATRCVCGDASTTSLSRAAQRA